MHSPNGTGPVQKGKPADIFQAYQVGRRFPEKKIHPQNTWAKTSRIRLFQHTELEHTPSNLQLAHDKGFLS